MSGGNYISAINRYEIDVTPALLYGVTDDFSALLQTPFAIKNKDGPNKSSGIKDLLVQFEYAPYARETSLYSEQLTVLAGVNAPTGSSKKNPTTGAGSPGFIVGATYARTYSDWYGFVSSGLTQTASHQNIKYGNQFLYQAGLGHNIFSRADELIVSWLMELDGIWSSKDKELGVIESDSGGNVVNLSPSLWVSTQQLSFQVGIGFPIIQKLNGNQNKNKYLIAANLGWTF